MSQLSKELDQRLIDAVQSASDGPVAATSERVQAVLKQRGVSLGPDQLGERLEQLAREGQIQRVDAAPGDGLPTFGFRPSLPS
jgi:hypothetical protein